MESTIDKLEAWRLDFQEDKEQVEWKNSCSEPQKQLAKLARQDLYRMFKGKMCFVPLSKLQVYWKTVFETTSKIFGVKVQLCVRGIYPKNFLVS